MNPDANRLFVFGLGYSSKAFVRRIRDSAVTVGTVRTPEKAAGLAAEGIRAVAFDGAGPGAGVAEALADATHVLVSVPPGEGDDPVLQHHADDFLRAANLRHIAYLSTVGVYGDYGGAWIDERTIPHPGHPRAVARLRAEAGWSKLAERIGARLSIFRIAGIYGPGRNPLLSLAEGKAHRVVKPGQVFNRIHVDDIAAALARWLAGSAPPVVNLSDDEPAPPQDVIAFAAGLMGIAPPPEMPFEKASLSPMARSFYEGNRRVANRRLREEMGVALGHATYREGLTTMYRDGTWRG